MWKPIAVKRTTEVSSVETCKCSLHTGKMIHAEQPIDPEHTSTLSVATLSPSSQGHSAVVEPVSTAAAFSPISACVNEMACVPDRPDRTAIPRRVPGAPGPFRRPTPPRATWLSSNTLRRQPPFSQCRTRCGCGLYSNRMRRDAQRRRFLLPVLRACDCVPCRLMVT